ncbi:MAG TPA: M4 family metallopeptidase [Vicinamibacterales bacterium]|nr:M4 family metallopeptidase [Vicinamibacterales bacterium]
MSRRRASPRYRSLCVASAALALVLLTAQAPATGRQERIAVAVNAAGLGELREWDSRLTRMERNGELRVRQVRQDTLIPGRQHDRLDQYHRGVRVFGGDVARQLDGGQVASLFGTVYEGIAVDNSPAIDAERAHEIVRGREGGHTGGRDPELVVLPLDEGGYALAWRLRTVSRRGIHQQFVDAQTGTLLLEYSDMKSQTVGRGRGVLGDSKKISITAAGGRFTADDGLRPPSLRTNDMQGDYTRVLEYLDGSVSLNDNDLASDGDNDWTDGPVVDAHVYAGYTYDYLWKQFNRRGLDDRNIPIVSLVHPVRRADVFELFEDLHFFYTNAFYAGDGIMVYGVGLPAGVTLGGQVWDFTSGALDIVAHELAHGVTDYSSALIYRNESGALNEAFSDIMAVGAEFFFQQAGSGSRQADYFIGEDVIRPGGIRSLATPQAFGDPDHYSLRFTGTADNGGVHTNSGIPSHAFYLAVEGGTNRTSGQTVQGVGADNRVQIERVFYRAFTQMLPAGATFATARGATIQAARDLFGSGSPPERAITDAWSAVGVN